MNALFPIRKQFSDLIFSGEKDIEFRNIRTKLQPGDTIYVYETKKNNGLGMVVGYFVCGEISEIPHHKIGTYAMLNHYIEKCGTEEEKNAVNTAMKIRLENHDDCYVLRYMFMEEYMEYLKIHKNPDTMFLHEYYKKNNLAFQEEGKAVNLLDKCDEWLTKIGFYNKEDSLSTWKYQIEILKPVMFEKPKEITEFYLLNGKKMKNAPQGFCYTKQIPCENV